MKTLILTALLITLTAGSALACRNTVCTPIFDPNGKLVEVICSCLDSR